MEIVNAILTGQEEIAPGLRVAEFDAPKLADEAEPGQFVHVRVGDLPLRRPFSVYRAHEGRIALLYRVKGEGTALMASWRPGRTISLVGPLGRGFAPPAPGERVVLVGGGIGVAPLAFFGDRHPAAGAAILGFRTGQEVCAADRLSAAGYEVVVTTEDGTIGSQGRVTGPLARILDGPEPVVDRVLTCGPWPMMAAVAEMARRRGIRCEAALEREMACGIGVCLGCVVPTGDPARPYLRVCTDGPVVPAEAVAW